MKKFDGVLPRCLHTSIIPATFPPSRIEGRYLQAINGHPAPKGLGNTRGIYCNSNSGDSEFQGIGQFLKPQEFYWKELVRSSKAQKKLFNK